MEIITQAGAEQIGASQKGSAKIGLTGYEMMIASAKNALCSPQ